MAAIRARGPLPVGSMQWIDDENAQVERHCEQEVEDFGFSARNELEWLNEHMADIFAKENMYVGLGAEKVMELMINRNVTEIFKTPGKLRGKTPRTARKRDPLQTRIVCIFIMTPWLCYTDRLRSPYQTSSRPTLTHLAFLFSGYRVDLQGDQHRHTQ